LIIESGGLLPFCARLSRHEITVPAPGTGPRPMNIAEKILAAKLLPGQGSHVKPNDAVLVRVDAGYSHEFTTAQVDKFLTDEYGDYKLANPTKFAVFEDHLIYATGVASMAKFASKIERLRELQRAFAAKTGVRNYSAVDGVSPGICHQVAREQFIDPGDLVQATDSHTCMGGASGALAWGVGATEYAALLYWGFTPLAVPESIRFELTGKLPPGTSAKDVMLHILATYAKREETLNRVMEFGGDGLFALTPDERATLANMATECSARGAVMEVDDTMLRWIAERRPGVTPESLRPKVVLPDPGAEYAGGVHRIDLSKIKPMVATPGDPDRGIASDPKNGALVDEIGSVKINIAYGGSCTAGKRDDVDMYARVMAEAERAGKKVADGVRFFIQFGSQEVEAYARAQGYIDLFERTGVKVIKPGCGACIGCGPGVSERGDQVTVSAINRNYKGRSGPGKLFLASPLTVAASAVSGEIVEYSDGMFGSKK
jgi:3-isopropylmalate/(R)-2-methylmalate dehydratase large subunit